MGFENEPEITSIASGTPESPENIQAFSDKSRDPEYVREVSIHAVIKQLGIDPQDFITCFEAMHERYPDESFGKCEDRALTEAFIRKMYPEVGETPKLENLDELIYRPHNEGWKLLRRGSYSECLSVLTAELERKPDIYDPPHFYDYRTVAGKEGIAHGKNVFIVPSLGYDFISPHDGSRITKNTPSTVYLRGYVAVRDKTR